jgi:hypothetical protein
MIHGTKRFQCSFCLVAVAEAVGGQSRTNTVKIKVIPVVN